MIIQGQEFNFDRVVKLTIFTAEPSENGKDRISDSITIEYDPLSIDSNGNYKDSSIARIDFVVNDIGPANRNQKPGFTADITLYNVTDRIATMIAKPGEFMLQMRGVTGKDERGRIWKRYISQRPQVRLEVGYSDGNGGAKINNIFSGYINSSFSYKKGRDYVTELKCFNSDDSSVEYPYECLVPDVASYKEEEALRQGNLFKGLNTWHSTIKHLIISKSERRPATSEIEAANRQKSYESIGLNTQAPQQSTMSNYGVAINALERIQDNFVKWFRVVYVTDPGTKKPNYLLEEKMMKLYAGNFATSKKDLTSALNDLCAFSDVNLNWSLDKDPSGTDPRWVYYVWQTGDGKTIIDGESADIKIINYQNLLEPPTINGNGNLTIKMMLHATAKPFKTVSLLTKDLGQPLDGDLKSYQVINASQFSETQQSVAGTLSAGNFAPLVQGPYAIQVCLQDSKSKGYLFNKGFQIIKVVHKGSSHARDWATTLTTVPMCMGLKPESK